MHRLLLRLIRRLQNNQTAYHVLNYVVLSRAATLHNLAYIQEQHPKMSIMPVLKANAYGHGLLQMAEIMNDAAVDLLVVDGYFEAHAIRHITKRRILVLGYIAPSNVHLLDTKRCSLVVQDTVMLEALGRLGRPIQIHVELNTGMNRLGLSVAELPIYLITLKKYPSLSLEGIMSHLADADNPDDDQLTNGQIAAFDNAVEYIRQQGFSPRFIHIAQTAGSTKAQSNYANAVRLGIGLYGLSPLAAGDRQSAQLANLRPVLTLKSTIIKVIDLRPGDIVGYNATFRAVKSMRLGVLPLGYYEGLPRALSNRGVVTAGRHVLPIVGRISMNHTMIDLGASGLEVGDEVTAFSANPADPNSVTTIAKTHDLFAYNLLTAIAPTLRRIVV